MSFASCCALALGDGALALIVSEIENLNLGTAERIKNALLIVPSHFEKMPTFFFFLFLVVGENGVKTNTVYEYSA